VKNAYRRLQRRIVQSLYKINVSPVSANVFNIIQIVHETICQSNGTLRKWHIKHDEREKISLYSDYDISKYLALHQLTLTFFFLDFRLQSLFYNYLKLISSDLINNNFSNNVYKAGRRSVFFPLSLSLFLPRSLFFFLFDLFESQR